MTRHTDPQIAARRLRNQRLTHPRGSDPASVVAWLGAVQAQEYLPAKWALALRLRCASREPAIERAIDQGHILRTHVMRPTWHFVARADIRWMLQLTGGRIVRAMASYNRQQGLETATLVKATAAIERALDGGRSLTRSELGESLARTGTKFTAIQLALISMYAEAEGVICSGRRREKQFTYALLSARAPDARALAPDEALAELTRRFLRSHGPATVRDFVWWSGLRTADAKRGLEMIRARAQPSDGLTYWSIGRDTIAPGATAVHLLPIYDEYVVAYRDRVAVPHGHRAMDSRSRGMVGFQHAVVIDGQIAGTWRTRRQDDRCVVDVIPLRRFTAAERRALADATAAYGRFLESAVAVSIANR